MRLGRRQYRLHGILSGDRKAIQYDGGNQTSYFYKFNGDLPALRAQLDRDKSHLNEHFWQIGVLAAHYLKRDSGQKVLILGSAGGQETKAALMYGAAHVDSVELVPTVVELGTGRYSSYIGDIFKNPKVHVEAGEGRSFLRHSRQTYDIIQVYSNHTSSSIAQGTGALSCRYICKLQKRTKNISRICQPMACCILTIMRIRG
jgi:spermidine synthase